MAPPAPFASPGFPAAVPAFVRAIAKRHGPRDLLVTNEERLTYAEADALSAALARGLLADGVGKGTRVGILHPNGRDWVVAWLAAARIGAIVVPISTFYQARELHQVLRHGDIACLLTSARFRSHDYLERLESAVPGLAEREGSAPLRLASLPYLRWVRVWGEHDRGWVRGDASAAALAQHAGASGIDEDLLRAVESEVTPADRVMIVYSSGSTAAPKGAVHSHGTVVRHALAMSRAYELTPEDRMYSPMPFFWVGGLVTSLLSPMHAGACVLTEEAFEPGRTLDLLERERATVVIGWPHFAKSMAEHPSFAARDLSSIRRGSLWELVPPALRPADPGLRSNSLGMTETCGPHTVGDGRVDLPESLRGTFGRAVPGVEHKIVHPDDGRALAPGESGEICVRGYSLMQGLYKVERGDVFDADGFYHTADAGYFDAEGWLFFQGRLGDLIKTAGANVAPAEVEAALVRQPGVAEAYAAGIPDRDRGELVAAAVIPVAGASLDGNAILTRLRGEISSYKVPRRLWVCAKSDLPFTDSGKIRRKDLAQMLAREAVEPAPARGTEPLPNPSGDG